MAVTFPASPARNAKTKRYTERIFTPMASSFTGKLFLNIFLILGRAFFMLSGKSSVGTRVIAILMTEFDPNGKTIFVRTIFDAIMNDDKFAYVMPLSINNFLGLTTIVKPIKRIAIPRYSENCKLS